MEQNLWTIIITYSAVQCFVLAFLLLYHRDGDRKQKIWLAIFLVLVGLLSLNFLFEYFQWYRLYPHFIWAASPLWFLVGPAIYFFSKHAIQRKVAWHWFDALHFLPFIAAIAYIGRFYLLGGEAKIAVLETFYRSYGGEPDYFLYAFLTSELVYGAYSLGLFKTYFKKVGYEYSDSLIYQMRWIRFLFAGFILFITLSFGYNLLLLYDFEYFIHSDYLTYLILSVFVQALGFSAILRPNAFFVTPVNFDEGKEKVDEEHQEELEAIFETVDNYMKKQKPYQNPELRLSDLSLELDIPSHKLSQAINTVAGQNFFTYVNSFRVTEVKSRLQRIEFEHLSLEGIAEDCGFNSSASFYRVFKQQTQMTPGQFIKQHDAL